MLNTLLYRATGLVAGAILLASAGHISPADAQSKFNMATPYNCQEFITKLANMIADDMRESTNGEVDITVHCAGSLFKNPEIVSATRTGQIDMGTQLMSNLGPENKLFEIDNMPFLTSNYLESWALWQATRPRLEELMQERGLRILYAVPWGPQNFFFNGDFKSMADVKGKKLRAYNASTSRMAALMNTVPVTVQATDMAQAFQTGIVHGTSTSSNTGVASNMHEFVSDVYLTNAWNPKQMGFIREAVFQKMTPSQQQALILAGKKAEAIGWFQSVQIADNAPRILAERGMKVHEADSAVMADLRGVGGTMLDEWLDKADAEAQAAIAAYKAAVGR